MLTVLMVKTTCIREGDRYEILNPWHGGTNKRSSHSTAEKREKGATFYEHDIMLYFLWRLKIRPSECRTKPRNKYFTGINKGTSVISKIH